MASKKRFKKLVHYVCDICEDPTKMGATKLNKALWYSDTYAYRRFGKTISGESAYVKQKFGPVPRNILPVLRELEEEGTLHVRTSLYFGKPKKEYQVLQPAHASDFTETEREIIRQVVSVICNSHTATSISDLSHDDIWDAAEIGEEIPVWAVLAANAAPVTQKDQKWATDIVRKRHQQ